MSKVIQTIRMCKDCADNLLGFIKVKEEYSYALTQPCDLCKKKKETILYRIMSERSGKRID